MTLNRLTIFAIVAKHLNFTRASEELHISQPSISQQIKALQEEYESNFYTKSGRGIELTEAGQLFYNNVKPILAQLEKLKGTLDTSPRMIKAEALTVGGSHGPSTLFLPSLLAAFKKNHPRAQITLRTDCTSGIERLILKSLVEIGVVSSRPKSLDLVIEPFRREKVIAFVPINHTLAKKRKLTLSDLMRNPLIIRGGSVGKTRMEETLRQLEISGFKPDIAMRCESPQAVKAAVKKKMGLGIIFRELVESDARNGQFKLLKLPPLNLDTTSFIIYKKDKPLSANARSFLTILRKERNKSK